MDPKQIKKNIAASGLRKAQHGVEGAERVFEEEGLKDQSSKAQRAKTANAKANVDKARAKESGATEKVLDANTGPAQAENKQGPRL